MQAALETATTALILAAAAIPAVVYAVRSEAISESTGIALLVATGVMVAVAAIAGALRRFPDHVVATRVDRASGLADRLATACEFENRLPAADTEPEETRALMEAALADAVRAVPKANVKGATPFRAPSDTRAAAVFAVVALAVAGLWWPKEVDAGLPVDDLDRNAELDAEPIEPILFEDDDIEYTRDLLDDLRRTAERDQDPNLQEFVAAVEELLTKAEKGELTKEELLEELKKAEESFMQGSEDDVDESMKDLAETGEQLKKNEITKELGKALEEGDLEKAQQEMEKLADKIENDELSEKEREQASKALKQASEKFAKKEEQRDKSADKNIQRKKNEIRRLQKKMDQEKNQQKREKMARRLEKKKRDLKRLQRNKQQRERSAHKRRLKRLHRNLRKAAENMRKQNQQQRKQASRNLRDAKQDTGRVDQDRRKVRTQQKVATQVEDLKEALRRAKRRGNRGPKDMFGRNKKNRDFKRRARGGKGQRGAWKPGQGQNGRSGQGKNGQGQNGNKPGGQGNQPGGDQYGDGHDPDLMGDSTAKGGHTVDKSVQGVHGKGASQRETVLSAAQKGFASRTYQEVYQAYKERSEKVMENEKVPSGYKYYVKKYFQKIKPHAMD